MIQAQRIDATGALSATRNGSLAALNGINAALKGSLAALNGSVARAIPQRVEIDVTSMRASNQCVL